MFATPEAEDCTPQGKLILVLTKFILSKYDTFCFLLSFSASFWTVFVEPGAAPPVNAKNKATVFRIQNSLLVF